MLEEVFKIFTPNPSYPNFVFFHTQGNSISFLSIDSEKGDGIKSRASYLGIDHCYVGNDPKDKVLLEWMNNEKILIEEVAFIGDDINDMSIINIVGFSACPADASDPVKDKVSLILESKGGYGCVREFSDLYLSQK